MATNGKIMYAFGWVDGLHFAIIYISNNGSIILELFLHYLDISLLIAEFKQLYYWKQHAIIVSNFTIGYLVIQINNKPYLYRYWKSYLYDMVFLTYEKYQTFDQYHIESEYNNCTTAHTKQSLTIIVEQIFGNKHL